MRHFAAVGMLMDLRGKGLGREAFASLKMFDIRLRTCVTLRHWVRKREEVEEERMRKGWEERLLQH